MVAKKSPVKPPAKKAAATAPVKKAAVKAAAPARKAAAAKTAPAKRTPAPAKAAVKKAAPPAATKPAAGKPTAKQVTKKAAASRPAAKGPVPVKKAAPAKAAPAKKAAPVTTVAKKAAPAATQVAKKAAPAARPAPVAAKKAVKRALAPSGRPLVREDESPWTAAELKQVRAALVLDVRRLEGELESAEAGLADLIRDSGEGAGDDQADAGSKTFEREHEMSLANNAREMLLQVTHAIARLDNGTYGACENCGKPIGKFRLQAFPRATLCLACKQIDERLAL